MLDPHWTGPRTIADQSSSDRSRSAMVRDPTHCESNSRGEGRLA